MYFVEDCILCFEFVIKWNCYWIFQYVKLVMGEIDVLDMVIELIFQCCCWFNGFFFVVIYVIVYFYQFFWFDYFIFCKFFFFIEFIFNIINMIFVWFVIGNFFLVFKILMISLGDEKLLGKVGEILGVVFFWLYGVLFMICFVLVMGNRLVGFGRYYMVMVIFWVIIFIYFMFVVVYIVVDVII